MASALSSCSSFFPSGLWGLPATGSWRAKESSGSGSVRSDIDISTSSLSGKIATLNHVNSERHRTRKLEPDTSPLWPQNSVAGDFLPPAVVVALFPSPNPAWAESHRRGFVAHSSLAVSRLNQCCGIVGIGWRVMVVVSELETWKKRARRRMMLPRSTQMPSPSLLGP